MNNNIKLSIITINYNNRDGLRKTIESVVGQTFRDFEYIIIDGGSTDGSVEVIKEYANRIDYWVSEKDKGIYNAMNKGAMAAHGEYLQFLNSGDVLCDKDVLRNVFQNPMNANIVCGNTIFDNKARLDAPVEVTMEYFLRGSLPHPSSLIKRVLFESHSYDERYKISGDWEFFMHHLVLRNVTYQQIKCDIALFDTTGISSTTNREKHDADLRREAIGEIIPPRVLEDYDIYLGKRDNYHKLFYTLAQTNYKNIFYKFSLFCLKIVMCNKGWIKQFSFC
jgi:glycosyltransferase involved in cell wall biosynthesis